MGEIVLNCFGFGVVTTLIGVIYYDVKKKIDSSQTKDSCELIHKNTMTIIELSLKNIEEKLDKLEKGK